MFCSECGKIIKEGSKFCKYCGGSQQSNESQSAISSFSISDYEIRRRQKNQSVMKIIVLAVIAVITVGLIGILGNYHECDWCHEKFVGTAYYDSWDVDSIMCEDCAMRYYSGFDYSRFQVQ